MKAKARRFKFAPLVILISGLCTSCTVSDYFNSGTNVQKESINVEQANQQIAQAKAAEQARLELEKQQQAEAKIVELMGNQPIQFYSTLAKIYAAREFSPIWQDESAKKKFLHEYAGLVASGISIRAAISLDAISVTPVEEIQHDILLTDAFLSYMYYTKKVPSLAQNWLYSQNSYKADKPEDELIELWLTAVQNNQNLDFVNILSASNHLYQETLQYISNSLAMTDKEKSSTILYKLALNAQRLRIIPSFENGIFVNIPSYQLNYYRDGELVLNSRVIVGKEARKTPVMYSKLSNLVVNPPWHIPNTILTKDIVPKLARDPGYAERASLEIFDSKGNKISAYSVNWSQYVNSKSVPFRIRQKAGDDSALGRFKFNMPSSDAIYLHDTPNRSLFNKTSRALSSGCVRVSKSDELASVLLKEAGWSMDKKQRVLASKKTTSVPIQSDNPVYLYYVTTWIENGKVQTLPDIYGYDKLSAPNYINWNTVQKYL
ncbi:L,D-transpeptidase family protein [Lonepinella koalarum]|uniref:L,D-transpeptidase-like protein n=1 Tax=Lonepinella koalarum TaxID=53417 RepID=A0A4R1KYE2_9PAST|nr:L,D-transpeptidase family protein [Lonepinella koalarum]MDH2926819.1 L,D-transpeptidase [Lonepinella koalarum]TCK70522.1 L,D-transpeptidase-like protein [Lonepinella koalarum]TFJ90097.1 L,D-transpeptidase [Lonepinella koalarum]